MSWLHLSVTTTYGYPPELAELATRTVTEQAGLLCADWVT